jgi:hypothetical protein
MNNEKHILERWKELPYLYKVQVWTILLMSIAGGISVPVTTKFIYSGADITVLSSRMAISNLIGVGFSVLWLNIQERLYKYFIHFTIIECVCYIFLFTYVIIFQDVNTYLILSTIIGTIIGNFVCGAHTKMHQKITNSEQARTDYGFFISIFGGIGICCGAAIASFYTIPISIAMILLLFNTIADECTDVYIYMYMQKNKRKSYKKYVQLNYTYKSNIQQLSYYPKCCMQWM